MSSDSQLLTCPRCKTPNFSRAGLRTHRCRGTKLTDERRALTAAELAEASSGSTDALSNPAQAIAQAIAQRERMSTGQDAAIAEQLVAQYRKAETASARIAEANLDLVVFGGMLAQLEAELASRPGPRRGPGSVTINGWLQAHAPSIDQQRASELKRLASAIAERFALDTATLQGLLTATPETVLPKGQSRKRTEIIELLGAGSIHRLHMQFGSRKHGGARVSTKVVEQPTTEDFHAAAVRRTFEAIEGCYFILIADHETYQRLTTADIERAHTRLGELTAVLKDRLNTRARAERA